MYRYVVYHSEQPVFWLARTKRDAERIARDLRTEHGHDGRGIAGIEIRPIDEFLIDWLEDGSFYEVVPC